jgi:hypothetical protein
MMSKNEPLINSKEIGKSNPRFKFSLFSESSDVWILAIALLILLVISFINEKKTYPSSIRQIQNNTENIIPAKSRSGRINLTITEDKAEVVRLNITDSKLLKTFLG